MTEPVPFGCAGSQEFIKHDKEKEIFSLIDPNFEAELAKVLTHGAQKYADDNWKNCKTPWRTYYSALRRHLAAVARGQHVDPDSGEPHMAHIACNVMFLAWFAREGLLEVQSAGSSYPPPPSEGKP